MKSKRFISIACAAMLLSSCIGLNADILLRANGSGTITLEYRVPLFLENLGKLDGNENWPAVPVGRADFERSARRIEGLKLTSFSAKTLENETVYTAALEFSEPGVLARFLDAAGSRAVLRREAGINRLALTLNGGRGINPDLLALFSEAARPYSVGFSFSTPNAGTALSVSSSISGAAIVPNGRKVSFQAPVAALFQQSAPITLEFQW
jgi:hypothetical protein